MISRERATELAAQAIVALPSEEVDTACASGRVVAADLRAVDDVPPFDRSQRDGYALRSRDTLRASSAPARLKVLGTLLAGEIRSEPVRPGTCVRVMTGAPLPPGADAILMSEEARQAGPEEIEVSRALEPGRFVDAAGREVRSGDVLVPAGTRLDPALLAVALSCGAHRLRVHRVARAAVLGTGSEVVPPREKPGPAQIRGSNPWMLAAALERLGAEVKHLGIVADRESDLRERLEAGRRADLLIVSGGTGPGQADLTHRVLESCGAEVLYHGIAMDPGRPTLCARWGSALVFGVPGMPVAGWVVWRTLIAPLLRRLAGEARWKLQLGRAQLASPLDHARGRESWYPADLSWKGAGRVARPRTSRGRRSMLEHAGWPALVRIPPANCGHTLAGAEVDILEPGWSHP
ncbi:MAG: gephyrin-like molybdotransferase Glp [Acidobacteriota bacterium]